MCINMFIQAKVITNKRISSEKEIIVKILIGPHPVGVGVVADIY